METPPDSPAPEQGPSVYLFVTCLADLFRPSVAFNSIRLLEHAGCQVSVPTQQTCCGQPAYNSGDYQATAPLAKMVIKLLEPADYVVVPSGSCAGMICQHYPKLLDGEWRDRALEVAAKTFEITLFLHDILKVKPENRAPVELSGVTYHDSCSGLRELGIKQQPRQLIQAYCATEITELAQSEVCCGFGGAFCAKMPEISGKMVNDKLNNALCTQAGILAGGDLGCLMNIAGRARRLGREIEIRHIVELLAGDLNGPAIGDGE